MYQSATFAPLLDTSARLTLTRRHFLNSSATGIGLAALASLLGQEASGATKEKRNAIGGLATLPHFAPRARRVIYLVQAGSFPGRPL